MALRYTLLLGIFCVCLGATSAQFEVGSEVLVLDMTQNNFLESRVGCRVDLRCSGNGTSLEWRRFGLRSSLMTSGNLIINTTSSLNQDDTEYFQSTLTLNPLQPNDGGAFLCSVGSLTLTARLRVEEELADVEVSNFDISRSRIGDNLPITCDVDTCASNVMVQLLRGDTVVNMSTISNPAAGTTSFNPLISQGFSGEYSCSVMGSHNEMEFTVTQAFNVTGTPLPPTTPTAGMDNTRNSAMTGNKWNFSLVHLFSALLLVITLLFL